MKRREFLRWQARGAMIWAASAAGLLLPDKLLAAEPELAVAKGKPGPATRAAVELLGGMKRFVKPGQRVAVKPNISFAQGPEYATNTHPDVVREIAVMCLEAGAAEVFVLDHPFRMVDLCLDGSGIRPSCKEFSKVSVQGLLDPGFYADADIPKAVSMRKTQIMKDVLKADVLIAAPVAKSHADTGVSLSMKGMMGLVWDRKTMHMDHNLDQAIVDLNRALKANLAIVDATRVLADGGPAGPGKILTPNTIIASADIVAADAMAVASFEWYGQRMKPNQVGHLRLAHEQGLGRLDIDAMRVATAEG
jgi:uncharacterized protein (DUF362 family)